MNIILVLIDSLNRHALSAYGPSTCATPNLDAFAKRAWRFDNHFVGSLPCMPARREIYSGFSEMLWRPWGPLEPFDQRLPKRLEANGYATAIVTDHYHYWEDTANGYVQSFQSAEFIRGHELDFWKPDTEEPLPEWVRNIERYRPGLGRRYFSNVVDFDGEEDFFPAKVMTAGGEAIKALGRGSKPFFLQVENFDVHEPFDVPEPYASMYAEGADRNKFNIWPPYQNGKAQAAFLAESTEEELKFLRSHYMAKLTMVDTWFAKITQALDDGNLWDDTVVIVTTDHGHDLGYRNGFGKQYPHYDSHANIPLFVWHPALQGAGQSATGLTSTIDLFATILDVAGLAPPERTHSRSIVPLMVGDPAAGRDALIYGTFGEGICCTDGEWTLMQPPQRDLPLYAYSTMIPPMALKATDLPVDHGHFIPGVEILQWQIKVHDNLDAVDGRPGDDVPMLFHRARDPGQTNNLWKERPDERDRMLCLMRKLVDRAGAPPEIYPRLGLESHPAQLLTPTAAV